MTLKEQIAIRTLALPTQTLETLSAMDAQSWPDDMSPIVLKNIKECAYALETLEKSARGMKSV